MTKEIETMIEKFENEVVNGEFKPAEITSQLLKLARLSEKQKEEVDHLVLVMEEAKRNAEQVSCPEF